MSQTMDTDSPNAGSTGRTSHQARHAPSVEGTIRSKCVNEQIATLDVGRTAILYIGNQGGADVRRQWKAIE